MPSRGAADALASGPAAGGSAGEGACSGGARHHAGAGGRGPHEHAGGGKRAAGGTRSVINLSARAGGGARRSPWCTSQAGTADGVSLLGERQARSAAEDVPAQQRARATPSERKADGRGQGLGSAQGLDSPGQDRVSVAPLSSQIACSHASLQVLFSAPALQEVHAPHAPFVIWRAASCAWAHCWRATCHIKCETLCSATW